MFPDVIRDDAFQIGSRRILLRWPRVSDCAILLSLAHHGDLHAAALTLDREAGLDDANRCIFDMRAGNIDGHSLVLALVQKGAARQVIGFLALRTVPTAGVPSGAAQLELGIALIPSMRRRGFAKEAIAAVAPAAFGLTSFGRVIATARPDDHIMHGLLGACGFMRLDERRWTLDRRIWLRRDQSRRMPAMVHQDRRPSSGLRATISTLDA